MRIQSPDVATRVRNFFGIKGKYRPEVEEFIVPTIQVGDLSVPGLPPITRHASVGFDVGAVVGEYFTFRLLAPEGVLCVITDLNLVPALAGAGSHIRASFVTLAGLAPAAAGFTDHRLTSGQRFPIEVPAAQAAVGTFVMPIAPIIWRTILTDNEDNHIEPKGWVIGTGKPGVGASLMIQSAALNLRIHGSVQWDEYQVF